MKIRKKKFFFFFFFFFGGGGGVRSGWGGHRVDVNKEMKIGSGGGGQVGGSG